jgi:integrase
LAAKAYRLLRAVLWTAVREDELIPRNPCRIPGADKETPDERPTLTLAQVRQLAAAVPARYSAMVMVAAIASLRYGEIIALHRRDVDLSAATIQVRQQYQEVRGQGLVLGPPKSRAGRRTLVVPAALVAILRSHMDEYVPDRMDALVFTGPTGVPILRGNFNKLVGWKVAVASIGVPKLHFHDLRHTGNVLAAASGVSTRDLMARMGQDSMAAALIYQHASRAAAQAIADHLDAQLAEPDESDDDDDEGTPGVLVPTG